jgi:UDP-glucose 4-epimerase
MGRRVLVTGLGTFWGGRVAKALEADPTVDVIVGLDTTAPTVELERTEFVRVDESYSILNRIVTATQVDTIIHTFLVVSSAEMGAKRIHETNVIGTMNLFAAASQPASSVRNVIVKSSTHVYGSGPKDPVFFRETSARTEPARLPVERSLIEVESYVSDFAEDNPHVNVALLRFGNVLGADIVTPVSRLLELPVVPHVFGFDPRIQFVHEDDVVRAILFVLDSGSAGIFNVAGDGLLPWSEVCKIAGKPTVPMPPLGRGLVTGPLKLAGYDIPPELMQLLTYGRGADTRRLKRAGFRYEHTSAGAVESFVEALRLRRIVGDSVPQYQYETDVEQFFRHSPAVVRDAT